MEKKQLIERVVNTFETGSPAGRYDCLVVYPDGRNKSRQITYGRSQTTEQGNLGRLVNMYCNNGGLYSKSLSEYIDKIGESPLCDDQVFKNLLISAAREDVVMRTTQDEFFDTVYWKPAEIWFHKHGFKLPLSMLVIYDSFVHSGGIREDIRKQFPELPPSSGGEEKAWITEYVHARHNWLKNRQSALLRKTIYRTQTLINEIEQGNWNLQKTPIYANGIPVT